MAAPDPFSGTAEEFTQNDWKEVVAARRPSGPNMFSRKTGEGSMIGVIDAAKVRGCLRYCLGYNAVSVAGGTDVGTHLYRTNPVPHPRYPSLYCVSAAEDEFAPDGAGTGPGGRTTKVSGNTPLVANIPVLGGGFGSSGSRAKYKKTHVTLRFAPLAFDLLDDSAVVTHDEYRRNTWVDQEPRVELISLSGFQLTFTEGVGLSITAAVPGPIGASSPAGNPYPAEVGQALVKSDLRVTWDSVPETYVMKAGTQIPPRVLYRLGSVNNAEWLGYARGTLMLSGARFTRNPWAIFQRHPNALTAQEAPKEYTVEFLMSYFNPPKGYTGDPAVRITTELGWNNAIWRGGLAVPLLGTPLPDANAGKFFIATYDGAAIRGVLTVGADVNPEGSNCQFRYTDFTKLFDAAANGAADGR